MITKDTSGEYINEVKKSYERISELLGSKIDVGKAGYVKLINAYGSDALIVESARQSYKMEDAELTEAKIKNMILSMTRNGHTSPFEQCSITFKIKMPIFVTRQWCLSGRTKLHFANGYNKEYRRKMSVSQAYNLMKLKLPDARGRCSDKSRHIKNRFIVSLDEKTKELKYTHIKDIWEVVIKKVYKVTARTQNDYFEMFCTDNHPIYTNKGWMELKDIIDEMPTLKNKKWKKKDRSILLGVIGRTKHDCVKQKYFVPKIDYSNEIWKDIEGYSLYEVSNCGRVRRKDTKNLKAIMICSPARYNKNRYYWRENYKHLEVSLQRDDDHLKMKKVSVHRLVAKAFCEKRDPSYNIVRHIDGNTFNNQADNLVWGTNKENTADSISMGQFPKFERKLYFVDIEDVKYFGNEMVYDIEIDDECHNFVSGGFVSHNCRNRTARLNEASMRYTKSNGECWEPDDHTWEMRILSKDFDESKEDSIINEMEKSNKASVEVYNNLINKKVFPELARITLPLSSYTEFVWNMDLNNLRKMLCLRLDGHAQKEIFQFAVAIYMLTEKVFPITMKHFINEMYLTSKFNYESMESIQRAIYAGETDAVAEKIDTKRLEVVRNREALLKEIDYLSK